MREVWPTLFGRAAIGARSNAVLFREVTLSSGGPRPAPAAPPGQIRERRKLSGVLDQARSTLSMLEARACSHDADCVDGRILRTPKLPLTAAAILANAWSGLRRKGRPGINEDDA